MTVFDLIFACSFLLTVGSLSRIIYLALRGRRTQAVRVAARLTVFLVLYLGTLVTVSLMAPQRIVAPGEPRCFDDWCVAVEDARQVSRIGYVMSVRVSSRARRVRQSAPNTTFELVDLAGRSYDPSPEGQQAYEREHGPAKSFGTMIGPGEGFDTVQVFDLPGGTRVAGLVVRHGQGPGWFVIGDDQSLFHKPTLMRISARISAR